MLLTYLLEGLIMRCNERAIVCSLSMNRMASMPEMLEPMSRPSL